MNIVTELEAKLHALALEVRDDIAALIKQFRSGAAVTDEQLQEAHDKLHAGITDGGANEPSAPPASDPQFPGEPVLAQSPEGVLVDGAGIVSTEHLAAAGVPIADTAEGATQAVPSVAMLSNEQPAA